MRIKLPRHLLQIQKKPTEGGRWRSRSLWQHLQESVNLSTRISKHLLYKSYKMQIRRRRRELERWRMKTVNTRIRSTTRKASATVVIKLLIELILPSCANMSLNIIRAVYALGVTNHNIRFERARKIISKTEID